MKWHKKQKLYVMFQIIMPEHVKSYMKVSTYLIFYNDIAKNTHLQLRIVIYCALKG